MRRALVVLVLALVGCRRAATPSAARVAPPPPLDAWVLTTLDGANEEPAYLSNGLLGVRVGRNGGGLGPDGRPLGFFMIDEYEGTGEEKIRPMPNPLLVTWALGAEPYKEGADPTKTGGTPLDPRGGTDYRQSLDMRTGVLTTSWSQEGAAIRCETVLHPTQRALGQRWTITPSKATTYAVRTLDYGGPNDPQEAVAGDQEAGVALTASPRRVVTYGRHVTGGAGGALVADKGFRVQDGSLKAGETVTFERTLSFGAPAAKPLPVDRSLSSDKVLEAATPRPWGYAQIQADAAVAWKRRWRSDIEIEGPVEDQQAVRSFLFYLRSSIAVGARRAIAPDGAVVGHLRRPRLLGRGRVGVPGADADGPGPGAGDRGVPAGPGGTGGAELGRLGGGRPSDGERQGHRTDHPCGDLGRDQVPVGVERERQGDGAGAESIRGPRHRVGVVGIVASGGAWLLPNAKRGRRTFRGSARLPRGHERVPRLRSDRERVRRSSSETVA